MDSEQKKNQGRFIHEKCISSSLKHSSRISEQNVSKLAKFTLNVQGQFLIRHFIFVFFYAWTVKKSVSSGSTRSFKVTNALKTNEQDVKSHWICDFKNTSNARNLFYSEFEKFIPSQPRLETYFFHRKSRVFDKSLAHSSF